MLVFMFERSTRSVFTGTFSNVNFNSFIIEIPQNHPIALACPCGSHATCHTFQYPFSVVNLVIFKYFFVLVQRGILVWYPCWCFLPAYKIKNIFSGNLQVLVLAIVITSSESYYYYALCMLICNYSEYVQHSLPSVKMFLLKINYNFNLKFTITFTF